MRVLHESIKLITPASAGFRAGATQTSPSDWRRRYRTQRTLQRKPKRQQLAIRAGKCIELQSHRESRRCEAGRKHQTGHTGTAG